MNKNKSNPVSSCQFVSVRTFLKLTTTDKKRAETDKLKNENPQQYCI